MESFLWAVFIVVVLSQHFALIVRPNLCRACDADEVQYGGSCYYFSQSTSSFYTSKSSCESRGMHLVSVGSQQEQQFLVDNMPDNSHDYYIGLTNLAWLDGSRLTYDHLGGVSSSFDQGGICFRIVPWLSYTWLDMSCSATKHYICEKEGACDHQDHIENDGSCYYFSQSKTDFYASKALCENLGMHLVVIESQQEEMFLVDNLPTAGSGSDSSDNGEEESWIGLTSLVWLDGSGLFYQNFGNPPALFDDGRVCFRMAPVAFKWLDIRCSKTYHYICEKEDACNQPNHVTYDGSCYHFSQTESNFYESSSSCKALGMHLVYIGSQQEQDFLENNLPNSADYWIGLSSVSWVDGSSLTYLNFGSDFATFNDGGICYGMRSPDNYVWKDKECSDGYRYICEKKNESPVPATTTTPASSTTHTTQTSSASRNQESPVPASTTTPASSTTHTTQTSSSSRSQESPLPATTTTPASSTTHTTQTSSSSRSQSPCASANFRLLADETTLVDAYVRSSYTVWSLIECGQWCVSDPSCSCFTYSERERECLLAENCRASSTFKIERRSGAKTYTLY